MDNTVSNSGGNKTALVKIQRFGNFLSGMVMPNLGVFVAWGILTALFIPTGWIPNDYLGELVGPILTYAMPMLIGYTGGKMVHGNRGGAIGVLATMGVIVGADVTMLSGAMLMGPLAAWLMKKVDGVLDGKFKPGFEMLVSNFSMGILGLIIVIAGYVAIGPVMQGILNVLSGGVNWVLEHKLLPLLSIFVAPAQVLFLNNAINHGIMAPLGLEQVAAAGYMSFAHLNPAVTIGMAIAGKIGWDMVVPYILGQMIGAIIGAVLVYIHYYPHWKETKDQATILGVFATGPAIRSLGANLISEIIGTFMLVFALLAFGMSKFGDGLNPIAVGILILVIGLSLGGTTGYAINPARDLGPRIAHAFLPIPNKGGSDWGYALVPIAGPIIGGILAALLFMILPM